MNDKRHFWVFERNPFDVIKLPEFTLLEGALIVGSLITLGLYLMLIVYLDAREKRKARRAKQMAWLERWLEHLSLSSHELGFLDNLAGKSTPAARYDLLSSPTRLEFRLQEALSEGREIDPSFAEKLRVMLGYTSQNLRVPVVSTRQLVIGDPVRISFSAGGMPHHFYGRVTASGALTFAVEAHKDAAKSVAQAGGEADLFYIRALGLEYPFAHITVRPGSQPDQLVLRHMLARPQHAPRAARLPLMLEVGFRTRSLDANPADELDPDKAPSPTRKGLLLDISTGGFCLGHEGGLEVGQYVEFRLPLKRRRKPLTLTGRVKSARPFTGDQWLTRCELRGLDSSQRKLLGQILRGGLAKRLQTLAPIRGSAAKAGIAAKAG